MTTTDSATWEAPKRAQVFISYSRSEAALVHDLGKQLCEAGYDPWIDFEELTPGEDWSDQLDEAIDASDVALLVVSKRAVWSDHVSEEWHRALARGIPMLLVIAEAASLDDDFAELPWVDVRRNFDAGVRELTGLIESARLAKAAGQRLPEADPVAPTSGFRAPKAVWTAFLASIPVAVMSLAAFWTIIVPVVLVPLPARILRRSFNYTDVRNALLGLTIALISMTAAIDRAAEVPNETLETLSGTAIIAALVLFLAVRSQSFRRWAKPAAGRAYSTDVAVEVDATPPESTEPVTYRIDAVSEDRKYAEAVVAVLDEYGHVRDDGDRDAVTLRFISQYHDATEIDSSGRTVPIIVADPDDDLPPRLQRQQWIDLRRGAAPPQLHAIGRHLHEPDKILEAIGAPPPHEQRVLPNGVQGLFVALWVSIAAVVGYGFLLAVGLRGEIDVIGTEALVWTAVLGAIEVAVLLWMTRKIRKRTHGRLRASLLPLVGLGAFAFAFPVLWSYEDDDLSIDGVEGIDNANAALAFPLLLLFYFWLFRSRELRRWIPAKSDDSTRDGSGRAGTTGGADARSADEAAGALTR